MDTDAARTAATHGTGAQTAIVPALGQPHWGHVHSDQLTLDGAIAAWLHETFQRSQSERTVDTYRQLVTDVRGELARGGLDLDAGDERAVALLVQAWAGRPRARDGKPVAPATYNLRLATLSSFYAFARRYGLQARDPATSASIGPIGNPATLVKRAKVHAYAGAEALDASTIAARLAAIDTRELAGLRDLALLAVALTTGRRASELAALRWGDLTITGSAGRWTVTVAFRRTKGGKQARDRLDAPVASVLLAWLAAAYGAEPQLLDGTLPAEAPLWLALGPNARHRPPRPLSVDAIADVVLRRLGTSKIHATRHSFAAAMRTAGADVTMIQSRLGHSSLDTTGRYLRALESAENPLAGQLSHLFGLDRATKTRRTTVPQKGTKPCSA